MDGTPIVSDAERDRLKSEVRTLKTRLFYGLGSIAFGVKDNGFQTILLPFYSQALGLPPAKVGLVLLAVFCVDALLDPIIGQFSDNLHTRWGRRHPLMYASAVPVAMSYLLLWNPPHWSDNALLLYLFVVATLVRGFISCYEIPSQALNPELTEDYDQRTRLSSYRVLFAWTGGMALYLLALRVFLTPDKTYAVGILNKVGYAHYGFVAAAVMIVAILISTAGTQKFIPILRAPPMRTLSLGQYLKEMAQTLNNRAFLIFMAAQMLFGTATGLVFGMSVILGTYFWGLNNNDLSVLGLGTVVAFVAAFFVAVPVSSRLGKRRGAVALFALGLFIALIPITLRLLGLFLPNGSPALLPILFGFAVVSGAMTIGSSILMTAMLSDVVEDSELKTGQRSEGLFFAGSSIMAKAVTGLGIFATGSLLGLIGFPARAVPGHVDPHVVQMMGLLYVPFIVVLYALGIATIWLFPIDKSHHEENLRRLAAEAEHMPASEHP